ncbi:MAG: YitT family protein [Pseudomonadota bacterium]
MRDPSTKPLWQTFSLEMQGRIIVTAASVPICAIGAYRDGLHQMGLTFTLKSLAAVATLSVLTEVLPITVMVGPIDPAMGIVIFGIVTSVGLIAVFWHGASIGGITILGLVLQEKGVAKVGHIQMAFDVALFATAFWILPNSMVLWSLAGAVILNVMVVLNHRYDRYIVSPRT